MASSSQFPQIEHDVFISFRGTDTRRGFVSHLSEALRQKKIVVFVDDKLKRGDEISTALLRKIERSLISLIVFSRDYAFSKWCLDELVKIMTCRKINEQVVIPIFHDIDPTDVRHLKGRYGVAIAEYGEKFKDNMVKVCNWRTAMNEAANLSGFHSSNFGTDAELIKQIVDNVLKRLEHIYKGQNNSKVLVGIHEQVGILESLAAKELDAIRVIGIWGMGGIGKTTIARELYDRLCSEYEACYFMPNVREKLQKCEVTLLQKELFGALLEEKDEACHMHSYCRISVNMMRLRRKKVLLVLDDVDDLRKIRSLYGGHDWFGQGSRIIVTSRDKQMLTNVVDDIYEVQALKFEDCLQLFSLHAFKENDPKSEWMDLSKRAVEYGKGIPLAIEVLGSSLFRQEKKVWESQLKKLKKMPLPEIQNVLRLSYDRLDREEQDIFLHFACFYQTHIFLSKSIFDVILDDCGYSTQVGLTKLCNKALLVFDGYPKWKMHDVIRFMGQEIVYRESRDPWNRRHLWDTHDVYQVLENATGTGVIQSLSLDMEQTSKELHLNPKAFNGMFNLKFLKLDTYDDRLRKRKMFAPKDLESMPNSLRLLSWKGCPLKSLPSSFCAENLFELDLSNSCLEKLWDGVQNLVNLKYLRLVNCEQLTELPDFSKALNLQSVHLSYCRNLCYLHPSILSLQNLWMLYLNGCEQLMELPDFSKALNLQNVHLSDCRNLCYLHPSILSLQNLRMLYLNGCEQLMELPDFSKALNLQYVHLSDCRNLCYVRPSILSLQKLWMLCLNGCEQLMEFPNFSKVLNLGFLKLDGCKNLKSFQSDTYLKSLFMFHAKGCSSMHEFSVMSERMDWLDLSYTGIAEVHSLGLPLKKLEILNCELLKSLPQNFLQVLDLWHLRKLTLDFFAPSYSFQFLKELRLSGTNIESLPASIKHLKELSYLYLKDCTKLRFLPELPPSICVLDVGNCVSLEEVSISTINSYNHNYLGINRYEFRNCWRLNQQTLNTIMSDAHVMMKQAAYIGRFERLSDNEIGVILPGSKVPADKYHYRTTTEATMTIQLSSQSNFLGVIFCLVISPCQSQFIMATITCYLQTSNGQEAIFKFDMDHDYIDGEVQCDSDHVFLLHDTEFLRRYSHLIKSGADNQCRTYNPKLSFTISADEEEIKIKEWGIYPIYGSDLFNFSNQLTFGTKTKRHRDADELLDIEALSPAKKLKIELKNKI